MTISGYRYIINGNRLLLYSDVDNKPNGRGRPATGRTTKVVRVPIDMDMDVALELYYDWLPVLLSWHETASETREQPRSDKLVKMFSELPYVTDRMREAGR